MSRPARILLFSPVFHDYWRSIARGFEADGHDVVVHRYDEHVGAFAVARNKVVFEGLDRVRPDAGTERFVRHATAGARAALRGTRADAIVVVKGDLLGDEFWDDVLDSGVPHVLWLYDELRRTRHTPARLARLGAIASYSRDDIAELATLGVTATHLPLAFDPTSVGPTVRGDEVLFIGARYPGRTRTLVELHRRGIPIRAVGRDWSRRPVDRLRSWSWSRPDLPSSPSVTRSVAAGMAAGAVASLNLHENQDGFTMRTFEVTGVGGVEIVDRADVADFYDPGEEILVAPTVDEMAEVIGRVRSDPGWAARIGAAGRARTLAEHTFTHRTRRLAALWR